MDKLLRPLNVLIACEESQAECTAFRALGHNAYSCDIQPCRPKGHPEWHIHADVSPYLNGETSFTTQSGNSCTVDRWDLIIAHPPCTYLSKVGALWLYQNPDTYRQAIDGSEIHVNADRWFKMLQGRAFFYKCLSAKAPYLAVENPIPMSVAQLPQPTCYADPSWYGVKYTKKTLYWLRNLPPLLPEVTHPYPKCFVNASRGKYRSRTFPQLAAALARQWSSYILDDLSRQSLSL